jgi:hypothetical protein
MPNTTIIDITFYAQPFPQVVSCYNRFSVQIKKTRRRWGYLHLDILLSKDTGYNEQYLQTGAKICITYGSVSFSLWVSRFIALSLCLHLSTVLFHGFISIYLDTVIKEKPDYFFYQCMNLNHFLTTTITFNLYNI